MTDFFSSGSVGQRRFSNLSPELCLNLTSKLPKDQVPEQCYSILNSAKKAGVLQAWKTSEGHGVKKFSYGVDDPANGKTINQEFLEGKSDAAKQKIQKLRTRMSIKGAINLRGVDELEVKKGKAQDIVHRKSNRAAMKEKQFFYMK